jgi:hypothetical protein
VGQYYVVQYVPAHDSSARPSPSKVYPTHPTPPHSVSSSPQQSQNKEITSSPGKDVSLDQSNNSSNQVIQGRDLSPTSGDTYGSSSNRVAATPDSKTNSHGIHSIASKSHPIYMTAKVSLTPPA